MPLTAPALTLILSLALPVAGTTAAAAEKPLLTGKEAMGDWRQDDPGVRRLIRPNDLPEPGATSSANNPPKKVDRPTHAWPKVPAGFKVTLYAEGFKNPRKLVTAPNGDIFVAESEANEVRILRDADGDGKPEVNQVFASGLNKPYGIAFHPAEKPAHIYIANTDSVVRFVYQSGMVKAAGVANKVADLSGGGRLTGGGHWTRDVLFSRDGSQLFISVGSKSNVSDIEEEKDRARILVTDAEGKNLRPYATGLRNPVGLALHPETGDLWTTVNERDELGDNLVPDYVTQVVKGGFYGWPWYYIGGNQDPHHKGKHPELKEKVLVPDVLLQSHSAALSLVFLPGSGWPSEYANNAFVCLHGSWNRSQRTGYKVVRIPTSDGKATGEYIDFMTGFVTPGGDVWGRPAGITLTRDGAMLVSDDSANCIWSIRPDAAAE